MNLTGKIGNALGVNRTVFSLSLARMADGIGNSILYVVIPLYVEKLPEKLLPMPKVFLIGILISAYGFATAGLQPFMAALSDRIGYYKQIIQAGLAFIALTTLGFIFADRYIDLLGLRIAQGLGLAMEIPPTLALLELTTRKEKRGSAMGFFTTLRMVGMATGPLLGGFLHDSLGFNAAFYAGAAVLFFAMIIVQAGVAYQEPPSQEDVTCSEIVDLSIVNRQLLSAAIATFLMASAFTLVTTLENQINSRLGIGAFGFGIVFSALMVGRLVFQVPMGHLSDRLGRKPFVAGGLVLMALTTALLGETSSLYLFAIERFVQGLASAAIVAPALAYAGDLAQEQSQCRRSRMMSLVTIGFGLGIAFGPLMAGALAIISYRLPFLVDGGLCLVGVVIVFIFMGETVERKPHRQKHSG
ncbi:MAG: MFS transporter [Desulfobacterales bacterium]